MRQKKRYPTSSTKLHDLAEQLEQKIEYCQKELETVRKLEIEAENSEIISTIRKYNITPEELSNLIARLQNNLPGPDIVPTAEPSEDDGSADVVIEMEENEDE